MDDPIGVKKCSKCGEQKPTSEFHKRGDTGKPRSWCKSCRATEAQMIANMLGEKDRERKKLQAAIYRRAHKDSIDTLQKMILYLQKTGK